MSENMLVLLKAVRRWPAVNMLSEPADTKHTVLFKHSNTGGSTQTFLCLLFVMRMIHVAAETTRTRSEDEEVGDVWFLAGGG